MSEFIKSIEAVEATISIRLNSMKKYNVVIDGDRTSITLEPFIWEILHEVADENNIDVYALCSYINKRKNKKASLSSSLRVFLISYLHTKV